MCTFYINKLNFYINSLLKNHEKIKSKYMPRTIVQKNNLIEIMIM